MFVLIIFWSSKSLLPFTTREKKQMLPSSNWNLISPFISESKKLNLLLRVNRAACHGDLHQLKDLVRAGADLNKTDYDGRSPLHLAASQGYEHATLFLIKEGVDINITGGIKARKCKENTL